MKKKWFNIIVLGMIVGIMSLGLYVYNSATAPLLNNLGIAIYWSYLEMIVVTVAVIIGAIGLIGMLYKVWTSR